MRKLLIAAATAAALAVPSGASADTTGPCEPPVTSCVSQAVKDAQETAYDLVYCVLACDPFLPVSVGQAVDRACETIFGTCE